jgi:hypothetical protein
MSISTEKLTYTIDDDGFSILRGDLVVGCGVFGCVRLIEDIDHTPNELRDIADILEAINNRCENAGIY